MNTKILHFIKYTVKKVKRQVNGLGENAYNEISAKGLVFGIYKTLSENQMGKWFEHIPQ